MLPTATTTTSPGARQPTSSAPSASAPTTSAAGGAIPAPIGGTYAYTVTFTFPADGNDPAESGSDVEHLQWRTTRNGDAVTVQSIESYPEDNSRYTTTYRTTATRHELVSYESVDEDGPFTCAYNPALLLLQLPLKVGAKWHADTTCVDSDGIHEHYVVDGEVTAAATDQIGGRSVPTFVVKTVQLDTDSDPSDPEDEPITYRTETLAHIDPATLLSVSEDTRDSDSEDPSYVTTGHRQLQSLTPT